MSQLLVFRSACAGDGAVSCPVQVRGSTEAVSIIFIYVYLTGRQ